MATDESKKSSDADLRGMLARLDQADPWTLYVRVDPEQRWELRYRHGRGADATAAVIDAVALRAALRELLLLRTYRAELLAAGEELARAAALRRSREQQGGGNR